MFLYLREIEVFWIKGEEGELCLDIVRGVFFMCDGGGGGWVGLILLDQGGHLRVPCLQGGLKF